MTSRVSRWGAIAAAVLCAVALVTAVFPWGLVARHAAGPISNLLGRRVVIGDARRLDWFGYSPKITLNDVKIAQPAWAGRGDIAVIRSLQVTVPVLPLLVGRMQPREIVADGLSVHLIRRADGSSNWSSGNNDRGGKQKPRGIEIRDGHLQLDDAKRGLSISADVSSTARGGLRIKGAGKLRNQPIVVLVSAPAIAKSVYAKPYPIQIAINSPLVSLQGLVITDHPLDTGHFDAQVKASGRDLGYLDDIIEAGLFRTQRFTLSTRLRHDDGDWRISSLDAVIGQTRFRAKLAVTKPHGRTRLDGTVEAASLDFDDFASDEQKARGAARKARIGLRIVPDTQIVLNKVKLDGRLEVHAARLLPGGSSPFRSLDGVVSLDDHRLAIAPLVVGLPRGRAVGRAVVDSRGTVPRLSVDLRIARASIESFFPKQQVLSGPLRARLRLSGSGPTVREALAHGNGKVAFVITGGTVRRDYATFLGGDVFKSIGAATSGGGQRTSLDCLIASFAVSKGRMTPHPMLLSTPVARGDGSGVILLGSETIDLRVAGHPTRPGPLLSTAPVRLFGTLSHPRIDIRPPRAQSQQDNGLLSRLGFFIKKLKVRGDDDARAAPPVSCPTEARRALD